MNQEFELIAKTFQGLEEILHKNSPNWERAILKSDAAWFHLQVTRQ